MSLLVLLYLSYAMFNISNETDLKCLSVISTFSYIFMDLFLIKIIYKPNQ